MICRSFPIDMTVDSDIEPGRLAFDIIQGMSFIALLVVAEILRQIIFGLPELVD